MLKETFIENILSGMYFNHIKGEELLKLDLEAVLMEANDEKENSINSSKLDLKDHE